MIVTNDIGTKQVEVRFEPPPNYDAIKAFFQVEGRSVFFSYAPYVYSPSGAQLPTELVDHEAMHIWRQQRESVEVWWMRYLTDEKFRLEEEIIAHIVEAKQRIRMRGDNRHQRRAATAFIGSKLASPLYGQMVKKREAMQILKEGLCQTS